MTQSDVYTDGGDINTCLRAVLQPFYANRWVADFLFCDLGEAAFLRSLPLSPSLFDASNVTCIDEHQRIFVRPPRHSKASGLPESLIANIPKDDTYVDYTVLHTLFLPLATANNTSVGYALCSHNVERPAECMPSNPLIPPFVARFAHDLNSSTLIYVNRGTKPADTTIEGSNSSSSNSGAGPAGNGAGNGSLSFGIRAVVTDVAAGKRHTHCFVIPNAPYRWPSLPTQAAWMLSYTEDFPCNTTTSPAGTTKLSGNAQQTTSSRSSSPSSTTMMTGSAPQCDYTPWLTRPDGLAPMFTSVSVSASTSPELLTQPNTSSAMFTGSLRARALGALGESLTGKTFGPSFKIDTVDPLTWKQSSFFTGAFSLAYNPTQPHIAAVLKQRFVYDYFTHFVTATCDSALSPFVSRHEPAQRAERTEQWTGAVVGTRTGRRTGSGSVGVEREDEPQVSGDFWKSLLVDAFDSGVAHEVMDDSNGITAPAPASDIVPAHSQPIPNSIDTGKHPVVTQYQQPQGLNNLPSNRPSQVILHSQAPPPPTLLVDEHSGAVTNVGRPPVEETPVAAVDIIDTFLQLPSATGIPSGDTWSALTCTPDDPRDSHFPSFSLPQSQPCAPTAGHTAANTPAVDLLATPESGVSVHTSPTAPDLNNNQSSSSAFHQSLVAEAPTRAVATAQTAAAAEAAKAGTTAAEAQQNPAARATAGERSREEILADRRRRNRLSAARSNERKRVWLAQLEQDVVDGREKVKALRSRLALAKVENEELKKRVASLCV